MEENLQIFHFDISPEDMTEMDSQTKDETLADFKEKYADCVLRDTPMQGQVDLVPKHYTVD
jgi:diketogulonate reductase-like aldo/keto reductase